MATKASCKFNCCAISDELAAQIKASADATRGKSMFDVEDATNLDRFHGAMSRCGVPRKPPGISKHMDDDGLCVVHPDNPPQPWTRGAEREAKPPQVN